MLLLLLLPGRWIQFEMRTDYCLGTLVPEKKVKVQMVDGGKKYGKIGRQREDTYLFQTYLIEIGASRNRGLR